MFTFHSKIYQSLRILSLPIYCMVANQYHLNLSVLNLILFHINFFFHINFIFTFTFTLINFLFSFLFSFHLDFAFFFTLLLTLTSFSFHKKKKYKSFLKIKMKSVFQPNSIISFFFSITKKKNEIAHVAHQYQRQFRSHSIYTAHCV